LQRPTRYYFLPCLQLPVPDCPLEVHPDTETMFIMRGPLGDPEPRTCPPGTYFLRSVCSCVNTPLDSKYDVIGGIRKWWNT